MGSMLLMLKGMLHISISCSEAYATELLICPGGNSPALSISNDSFADL